MKSKPKKQVVLPRLVLPPVDPFGNKTWPYFHVVIPEETIRQVKTLAVQRGMKLGRLVDLLLCFAMEHVS